MNPKKLEEQFNKDIISAFGLDKINLTEDEKKSLDAESEIIRLTMEEITTREKELSDIAKEIIKEKLTELCRKNLDHKCEYCDKSNESISECLDNLISGLQQTPQ